MPHVVVRAPRVVVNTEGKWEGAVTSMLVRSRQRSYCFDCIGCCNRESFPPVGYVKSSRLLKSMPLVE